eukprot:CAMPEP_0172852486 /NCGR_PEP_ID=MMETSP1075-20121228/53800_1 /TAXON_ID=2916 /ORGANISM="Ceratium fusus, Strain PA161109" /LENGTH=73 /DNA_ID=CAMNT_0013698759 /DNA_START=150 /DNA_END=368 /DNA_ORIENTATION=+
MNWVIPYMCRVPQVLFHAHNESCSWDLCILVGEWLSNADRDIEKGEIQHWRKHTEAELQKHAGAEVCPARISS